MLFPSHRTWPEYLFRMLLVALCAWAGRNYYANWRHYHPLPYSRDEVAIMEAVSHSRPSRVRELLDQDPSLIRTRCFNDRSLLHMVACWDSTDTARLLIERGADVDSRLCTGQTPLYEAAGEGDTSLVALLLNYGTDINIEILGRRTPLHEAVSRHRRQTAEFILAHGGRDSASPMLDAIDRGDAGMASKILKNDPSAVNTRDLDHQSPLEVATFWQNRKLVELLLLNGANVNSSWLGFSAIATAIRDNDFDLTKFLLEHGATLDRAVPPGSNLLGSAASSGNARMLSLLMAHGAVANTRDTVGNTLLFGTRSKDVARLIIAHGADVNAHGRFGYTALYEANLDEATVLLEDGADVNAQDDTGQTPLHYAARYGEKEKVAFLLNHGANPNALTHDGSTPLAEALYAWTPQKDCIGIAALIRERGNGGLHSP